MDWFDRLRQSRRELQERARRDVAVRLRSEVVRLYREARFADAARVGQALVDWQRAELGESDPDFARGLLNLALLLRKDGDHREAERILEEVVSLRRRTLGPDHPDTALADSLVEAWRREPASNARTDPEDTSTIPAPASAVHAPHPPSRATAGFSMAIDELALSASHSARQPNAGLRLAIDELSEGCE